jgi:hypothetical protein
MQMSKAAVLLQGKYEAEFAGLSPAVQCSDQKLQEKEAAPYRCFLVAGKLRNLALVGTGQRAVSARRLRDLEKVVAIRHWEFAASAKSGI